MCSSSRQKSMSIIVYLQRLNVLTVEALCYLSNQRRRLNTVSYQYMSILHPNTTLIINFHFQLHLPNFLFRSDGFLSTQSHCAHAFSCEERSLPRCYRTERYWPNWDNIRALKGCQQRMPIVIHQPTPTLALTVQRVLQRLGKDALKK